nr:hypothetical protein [Tanacetum cinerariifolium]
MSKRQKTDADLKEEEHQKTFLKIASDEEEVVDYEVLEKRIPIINWESKFYHFDRHGEECIYNRIFRFDGSSRWIRTFAEIMTRFDRLDLVELYNLVMQRFETTTLEGVDLILYGDLRIMFEKGDSFKSRLMNLEAMREERRIFKCWFYHHTTNGHQFTMSNRHQELASPEANGFWCGEPLYGFSPCRWCTCERCGVILQNGICPLCHLSNSCADDHNSNSFDCPPDSYHPPHPTCETYSSDFYGNDSQSGYDCPPQFPLYYEPEPGYTQNYNSCPHDSPNQAANTRYWKIPAYYDDDDDYNSAVTPNEPVNSLIMGDEHLDTISATKSDEFIKSSVENLVPNPSESEGENGCDLPACFTTFSNILFDAEYEFDSVDNQPLHNEDFSEEIFSNPLFEEEINSMRIDQHHFNAESDLVESMLNRDSSIIS